MDSEIKYVPVKNHGHPGTFKYNWFYYRSAIRAVLRPHRLHFKHPRYGRDDNFYYLESTWKRWHRLYNVPLTVNVPFTVYSYSASVGMMAILKDLGVNFRHLLHLKSEIKINQIMEPNFKYSIHYSFEEALRIKKDKAAIVGTTKVIRNGVTYMEVKDHFVIKNVPEKYLAILKNDTSNQFKGITRFIPEELENPVIHELFIKENYARDYGRASGDKNIVHTTKFTSTIFGFGRPFIQGLCTANLIMSRLCMDGFTPEFFSIVFCKPVYLESKVILKYTDKEYYLTDKKGHVLCFGKLMLKNVTSRSIEEGESA